MLASQLLTYIRVSLLRAVFFVCLLSLFSCLSASSLAGRSHPHLLASWIRASLRLNVLVPYVLVYGRGFSVVLEGGYYRCLVNRVVTDLIEVKKREVGCIREGVLVELDGIGGWEGWKDERSRGKGWAGGVFL
ncbi:hypothetical protein BJ508DRAFT_138158 [Ascobolus immersus RN42]|uniref:Uncharacterized protein n=1 Tax=Ascobolus immersus RN42 TaxID=1160509 RepID=A0A3N4I192_ASCIM|nr:hypothetical protein BJ508DRAFT_138158 [Ascobolus immersus RN42]